MTHLDDASGTPLRAPVLTKPDMMLDGAAGHALPTQHDGAYNAAQLEDVGILDGQIIVDAHGPDVEQVYGARSLRLSASPDY
jgi:hypothetical protein